MSPPYLQSLSNQGNVEHVGCDSHSITGSNHGGLLLGEDFQILLSESSSPDVYLGLFLAFPSHLLISYLGYAPCFHPCLPPRLLRNSDALGQPDLGNVSLLWVYLHGLKSGEAKIY